MVVAPRTHDTTAVRRYARSTVNRVRPKLRMAPSSGLESKRLTEDADLFFGVFSSAHELGHLPRLQGLHERCTTKIAFLVELWTTELAEKRPYLELLRGFDHVFLFSRDALPALREITGAPCSYLPTATDALRFAPSVPAPVRGIDVHSYGRYLGGTHEGLLDAHAARRLFYLVPTLVAGEVTDHRHHRLQLAAVLQRSRYTVVYRNNDNANRARKSGGEDSLTNRYFEAMAAGSVVVGSASRAADFAACFDWPDAVVPLRAPEPEVEAVLARLDADPERLQRARTANVVQSLRRHDWAHRWQTVLETAGLPPLPALDARLAALEAAARATEAAPLTG